jgi:hypothetical protein
VRHGTGTTLSSRLAARRARTRARIDADLVGAVTEGELDRIEGILVRAHDRAGVPYGAPLPDGLIAPDERARITEILRAARARLGPLHLPRRPFVPTSPSARTPPS